MRPRTTPYLLQVLGLALACGAASRLGQMVALPPTNVSSIWPSAGIAVAAIALWGPRVWPGIWVGAFVYNLAFFRGTPILDPADAMGLSVGFATGATLMALVAATLPRLAQGPVARLRTPRDALAWILGAGAVAPVISASIGMLVLELTGMLPATPGPAWRTWWLGDASGVILIVPPAILWARNGRLRFHPGQETEALVAACTLAVICLTLFAGPPSTPLLLTLPTLFLGWTAIRFGRRITATTAAVIAAIATWATASGHGPLLHWSPIGAVTALPAYMLVTTALALLLATHIATRRIATDQPPSGPAPGATVHPPPMLVPLAAPEPTPARSPVAATHPPSVPAVGALSQVLQALPDPVFVLARETLAVIEANDAFVRALELQGPEAVRGRSLFELFSPEVALPSADEARRVFHTGESREGREVWPAAGGGTLTYLVHRAPLRDASGEVTALLARARRVDP